MAHFHEFISPKIETTRIAEDNANAFSEDKFEDLNELIKKEISNIKHDEENLSKKSEENDFLSAIFEFNNIWKDNQSHSKSSRTIERFKEYNKIGKLELPSFIEMNYQNFTPTTNNSDNDEYDKPINFNKTSMTPPNNHLYINNKINNKYGGVGNISANLSTRFHSNKNAYSNNNLNATSLNYQDELCQDNFSKNKYERVTLNQRSLISRDNNKLFSFNNEKINQNHNTNKSNEIIDEKIISGEDNRTTLMIKNIPNKYNVPLLFDEIKQFYNGTFDYLYIPFDLNNQDSNLGYAFINFIHPFQILQFASIFVGKKWIKFSSGKTCDLTYANSQGKEKLINFYEKTKSRINNIPEDKKPYFIKEYISLKKIDVPLKYINKIKKFKSYTYENDSQEKYFCLLLN